ncbi:MAG: signal peptidase II [Spirochaetales bacterium]|nr:signal peptidase II [Spirochaetales bacterium]
MRIGKNNLIKLLVIVITISLNIGCDQVTKGLAREYLIEKGTINIIGNVFILLYAENTGAFLGMGSDLPEPYKFIFLSLIPTLCLIGFFIYIGIKKELSIFQIVCLSSVVGGGIGNIYDRLTNNGVVIDFMNFGIDGLRTGILNFADLSLTFGAVLFFISLYTSKTGKPDIETPINGPPG